MHTMVSKCSSEGGLMNINFNGLEVTLGTFATLQTVTRSVLERSLLVDHFSGRYSGLE